MFCNILSSDGVIISLPLPPILIYRPDFHLYYKKICIFNSLGESMIKEEIAVAPINKSKSSTVIPSLLN